MILQTVKWYARKYCRLLLVAAAFAFLIYELVGLRKDITLRYQLLTNTDYNMKHVGSNTRNVDQHDVPKLPLRERLAYIFPYDSSQPLEDRIRQTWKCDTLQDNCQVPFKGSDLTWLAQNPRIQRELITDDQIRSYLEVTYKMFPEVVEAFDTMPKLILKADFMRYLLMLAGGGTYGDIDTQCIKPIRTWAPFQEKYVKTGEVDSEKLITPIGLTVGIEADPDEKDWTKGTSRRIQFCQWTFQAKKGHPVLVELVARIIEETARKKRMGRLENIEGFDEGADVMHWTGPGIFTDTIFDYINNVLSDGKAGNGFGVGSKYWLDNHFYNLGKPALDENFLPLNADKQLVSWKNFTKMEDPKVIDDIMVLPIVSFFPGTSRLTDPLAYVNHLFSGSWKPADQRKGT